MPWFHSIQLLGVLGKVDVVIVGAIELKKRRQKAKDLRRTDGKRLGKANEAGTGIRLVDFADWGLRDYLLE